jgi:uncharacterized protein
MLRAIALFLATLCVFIGSPASAQDFPKLTGRVVDQADLLTPEQEASLTAKLAGLETQSNRQLVVATISDLQGYEISDYGYRLGRHWAIGQDGKGESEKDNGAILIVAPNERKMRIEVGYGLEPVLTDGLSSSIIRNDITPYFKAGDFNGGINAGVDRIVTQLTLPPEEAAKVAEEAAKREPVGGWWQTYSSSSSGCSFPLLHPAHHHFDCARRQKASARPRQALGRPGHHLGWRRL